MTDVEFFCKMWDEYFKSVGIEPIENGLTYEEALEKARAKFKEIAETNLFKV